MADRARWIREHYLLRETTEGHEALRFGTDGEVAEKIEGSELADVCLQARLRWGDMNFRDEAEAFNAIFPPAWVHRRSR